MPVAKGNGTFSFCLPLLMLTITLMCFLNRYLNSVRPCHYYVGCPEASSPSSPVRQGKAWLPVLQLSCCDTSIYKPVIALCRSHRGSVWLSHPSGLPVCFAPNTGSDISTWCGITVSYRCKQMSGKGSAPLSKWQDSSSRIKFYICLLTHDIYHIIPMAFSSICLPGAFVRPQMCLISNHVCCLPSSTSILGFPLNGKPYLFIKDPFSITQCPKYGVLLEQSWCDQNSLSHTSSTPLSSCVSLLCVAVAESEYRTYVRLVQKFWRLKVLRLGRLFSSAFR